MKSTIISILLISGCLADQEESKHTQQRPSRAPQGHIQYSDPDGLKVNWKLYAPYTQWKSHLEDSSQRNERSDGESAQPSPGQQTDILKPEAAAPEEKFAQPLPKFQVHYKPYSMVPSHIKQLILEMYEPQGPYVDPSVYIYQGFQQPPEEDKPREIPIEQEESTEATSQLQLNLAQGLFEHIPKYQSKYPLNKSDLGFLPYKDDATSAASVIPRYGAVPDKSQSSNENLHQKQQLKSQQYKLEQPQQYQQEQTRQYQYQQPQQYQGEQAQHYQQRQQPEYKVQQHEPPKYNYQQEQQQQQPQQQQQQNNAKNEMPKELHQLLNLQAQTPYHVIANRIHYKPKTIFVPKPIPEDSKGPYKYRSKVYYIKNDDIEKKSREQPELADKNEQQQSE